MPKAINSAAPPAPNRHEATATHRDAIRGKYGLAGGDTAAGSSSGASVATRPPSAAPGADAALAAMQSRPATDSPADAARRPRAELPIRTDYSLTSNEKNMLDARITLFDESIANLQRLADRGDVHLSITHQTHLSHLTEARERVGELQAQVSHKPGGTLGGREELMVARARVQLETAVGQCSKHLRELVLALPGEIVPQIHNTDLLNVLAEDVGHGLDAGRKQFARTAPDVLPYMDHVKQSMTEEIDGAMREAKLQHDMLATQGAAIEGFGQAGLDAHRHSISGLIGRHGPKAVRQAAASMGMNKAIKPDEYAAGMHAELGPRFGRLFDIAVEGERQVSINIKSGAAGYFTTPELLQIMEGMNDYVGRSRDRNAMEAFIKKSPDIEWATVEGERRLQLTAQARERLGVSETDALPETSAQERMHAAIIGGTQGVQLAELKVSIMHSFSEDLGKLANRAMSPLNLNPGLTHDKAALMNTLIDDLMAAPTAEKMLALVDQAIQEHESLWQSDWFARDSGKTGALLADLRDTLQRHLAQ